MTVDPRARWIAGLAAPIRARVGAPLDDLGGGRRPRGRKGDRWCKEQLRALASIDDRAGAIAHLDALAGGGTRAEYATYRRWLAELPREAAALGFYIADDAARLKRVFVFDHAGRPEETDVAAWDCARMVHYAGLAWGAGLLAEHEAWGVARRAAAIARAAYGSWEAYGRGFAYGRWFWQGWWDEPMAEAQRAVERVAADAAGPWALAWSLDLDGVEAWAQAPIVDERAAAAIPLDSVAVRAFVDCPACLVPILVRDAGALSVRCDACGERSEMAARLAWTTVAPRGDDGDDGDDGDGEPEEDDEDEGDGEPEADGDDGGAPADDPGPIVNLDDCIVRAARVIGSRPCCRGCGAPIEDAAIRAGAAAGAHRCACGTATAIALAPAWLCERSPRVRFVVGGPLALGRPREYLYVISDGDAG